MNVERDTETEIERKGDAQRQSEVIRRVRLGQGDAHGGGSGDVGGGACHGSEHRGAAGTHAREQTGGDPDRTEDGWQDDAEREQSQPGATRIPETFARHQAQF